MANIRDRRTCQEYALLLCGEFFRDEVRGGGVFSARLYEKFQELRDLCFDALEDPSMKDADDIRARYKVLQGVDEEAAREARAKNGDNNHLRRSQSS